MKFIEMWETTYIHVMPSHLSIIDWIKSTGMKPYLDRINNDNDKKDFEEEILNEIKKGYPKQKNACVLLPFIRLFFIMYK
jgi:trans-aconitate 2-methyltransferase